MATRSSVPAWEYRRQRSLVGLSPQGREELDTIGQLSTHWPLDRAKSVSQTIRMFEM